MRKNAIGWVIVSLLIAAFGIFFNSTAFGGGDKNKSGAGASVSGSVDNTGIHANVNANANPNATALALPAGFQEKALNEDKDLKKTMSSITEDAVTKDHFDNLIGYLANPDEKRVKDEGQKNRNVDQLNGRIDQIQRDWKAKYGEDFDIDKALVVFNQDFKILTGEVADEGMAMAHWPVPAFTENGQAMTASGTIQPGTAAPADVHKKAKGEKLDKGRNVALFQFPASHGLPAITVSMIHQLPDNWRIDVPDDRTGDQIYNDLLTHLTWLGDHKDQWPADKDDAYRAFAHHVVAALYGVPMPQGGLGATGAASQ